MHGGTEVIGWDPRTSRIRSWVFDSDGGFGENVWVHDGNRWLIKYSGTLADGSEASATHILTNVDAATATLQSKDRVVDDKCLYRGYNGVILPVDRQHGTLLSFFSFFLHHEHPGFQCRFQ